MLLGVILTIVGAGTTVIGYIATTKDGYGRGLLTGMSLGFVFSGLAVMWGISTHFTGL